MNEAKAIVDAAIEAADHASRQSDRWLFLATLIIGGCMFLILGRMTVRYFVKHHDLLVSDHVSAREKYHASLLEVVQSQHEMAKELAVCIERNTHCINLNTAALQDSTHQIRHSKS